MKMLVSLVLWQVFAFSCEGSTCDHDESILLQLTAGIQKRKSAAMSKQHRQFHIKGDHVALLEEHGDATNRDSTNTVYTICAIDNEGNGLDSNDGYITMETCGAMVIYSEDYKPLGSVRGCLPADVSEGSCFMFTESPDWTVHVDGVPNLFGLDLIDAPSTPQVLLVEVPDMNANQISEAENQLQAETRNSPGVGILLYGSGAPALRSRLGYYGYGQFTGFSFNYLGSEFWPTWEVVDGGLVLTMPTLTTLTPTLTTQTTQTPEPARRRRIKSGRRRDYDWRKDDWWVREMNGLN